MIIDLSILLIAGIVAEVIVIYFAGVLLPWTIPTLGIGVVIITLAIIRWKKYGLITIPIMALTTWIGGKSTISNNQLFDVVRNSIYDYKLLITIFLSYFGCTISSLTFKKISSKNLSIIIILLSVFLIQAIVLFLFGLKDDVILKYLFNNLFSNILFGIIVSLILSNILFFQKLFIDQVQFLKNNVEEKKQEIEYYDRYSNSKKR